MFHEGCGLCLFHFRFHFSFSKHSPFDNLGNSQDALYIIAFAWFAQVCIQNTNFGSLSAKMEVCKDFFWMNDPERTGFISLEVLEITLKAGQQITNYTTLLPIL